MVLWSYGRIVLLTGSTLGSLATVCGMIVGPGKYTYDVKEPWQALGYSVNKYTVKEELALGDGRSCKDGQRGRRVSQQRRDRKEHYETDESELMATWMVFPRSPNTQRNFNVNTVNVADNGENQESESLESGYAPRYLVKEVYQELAVLREFFRKVESLFDDVVHGAGIEIVKLIVCTGTPSFFAFVLCNSAEEKEPDRHEQGQEQKTKCRNKKELQSATVHSAYLHQTSKQHKEWEDALKQLAEVSQQTLQGIQTLADEIRNTAAAGSRREAVLSNAFQKTVATVQEQSTAAQEALAAAQLNAVTTMEDIGARRAASTSSSKG